MTVLVVTTDADSGAGSLRNALAAALTGDVIEFAGSLDDSIITLQSSLTIANGVTIDGGGDKITISGDDEYTDFVVSNAGAGGPATLEGLTIANGDGVGSAGAAATGASGAGPGASGGDAAGGVMLSSGSLNLVDDAFKNDTATGGTGGAAYDGEFGTREAGSGGNAAGALYVELGAKITASNLSFSNDTANPGQIGALYPGEGTADLSAGSAYAVSNFGPLVDPNIWTVTTDADSGAGSLRAALAEATTYDIIEFAPSLDNTTITLQSSLTIADGVTIDGIGDNITISGGAKYTDFIVSNAGASAPVTLEGLTIANGDGVGSAGTDATSSTPGGNGGDAAGGVMLSSGSLDLVDDAFNNDAATGGAGGASWFQTLSKPGQAAGNGGNGAGAVYVEAGAAVTASNLTFSNDTAQQGPGGAGNPVEPAGTAGAAFNITNYTAADPGVYTVTTDADSGAGSLRSALTAALTGAIIKFASALDGQTITLQSSLIIGSGVTIDGLGDDITISGNGMHTDFIVSNGDAGAPAVLEGLTIADGDGVGATGAAATTSAAGGNGQNAAGGLWLLDGAVNLVDDAFNNDAATGGTGGASSSGHAAGNGGNAAGAVYAEAGATVTATDVTFSGDAANAGQPGSNAAGGGAGSAGGAYAISNTFVDAGVYTVTTDADSGLGSLRAILAEARTGDWIEFASSLDNSTITLQSSLNIADGVTIDGFGDNISISGDDKYTDFIVANAGAGGPATLEGLIIASGGGAAGAAAGGLDLSSGAVTLYNDGFNGGALTLASSAKAGTVSLGAGSRLIIDGGDTLSLSGTNSLSGSASGAGTLAQTAGTTTFATGATLSTSAWSLSGAGTTATLGEAMSFAGAFKAGAGTRLSLVGGGLSLKGATTLSGLAVTSSVARDLSFYGATGISGLTIGGSVVVGNHAVATESGGSVTVGDAVATDKAELVNTAAGTWDIADNHGIAVGADASSLIDNAGLIEKTGGTATSTVAVSMIDAGAIAVASGTLAFSGRSNSFAGAMISGAGTVWFSGGSSTLNAGTSAAVANLGESGAGTTLTVAENLSYAGVFTQKAGSRLIIDGGDTLSLSGRNWLSGSVSGAGTLAMTGGATTFATGATLSTAAWSLSGAGTTATLGEAVAFAGVFEAGAGTRLSLVGGGLSLKGATTLSGLVVTSSAARELSFYGATGISGLSIGGSAVVGNDAVATESGGSVKVGDAVATDKAELVNTAAGTWDIADNSGIAVGADASSLIDNAGLIEKTGGTGTSTVAVSMINTGKIEAASGLLDLKATVAGAGTDIISGASTLEFNAAVAAAQTVDFTGSGGELLLASPLGFHGEISGFDTSGEGASDTIALLGSWSVGAFTENGAGTGGALALSSGSSHVSLDLLGQYQNGSFTPTVVGGTTKLTFK
jgi:hypothetical protein